MSNYNGGYFAGFDGGNLYGGMEEGGMEEEFNGGVSYSGGSYSGGVNAFTRALDDVRATVASINKNLGSIIMWVVKVIAILVALFILLHLIMFFLSGEYNFYSRAYLERMYSKISDGSITRDEAYVLTREHYFSTRAYTRDLTRARTMFAKFAKVDATSNPNKYMDSHRYDVAEFRYIMADNALLRSSQHIEKLEVLIEALTSSDKARKVPTESLNYYVPPSPIIVNARASGGDVLSKIESFMSPAVTQLKQMEMFSGAGRKLNQMEMFSGAGRKLNQMEMFSGAGRKLNQMEMFSGAGRKLNQMEMFSGAGGELNKREYAMMDKPSMGEKFTDDNSNTVRNWSDYIRVQGIDNSVRESHAEYIGNNPTNVPRNAALTIRDSVVEPVTRWGLRNVNYNVEMDGTARTVPSEYEDQVYKANKRNLRW